MLPVIVHPYESQLLHRLSFDIVTVRRSRRPGAGLGDDGSREGITDQSTRSLGADSGRCGACFGP
ncbi:hypothetical protein BK826_00810 [Rothia kristinae]|uniref:Uncharacterized protein n=1 Tax=Rothia kristinae TaxID=37923 RepID=A0A1S2N2L3_9MICC|nr:hypothetical protein BK826_00810 [Rothia kristinae]